MRTTKTAGKSARSSTVIVPLASRVAVELVGNSYTFDDDIHYGLTLALATGL